jgi:hypothetical protein
VRPFLAFATVLALLIAACSTGESTSPADGAGVGDGGASTELSGVEATIIIANSPGTISTKGPQRVLVALLEAENTFLGGDDIGATIEFTAPDGGPTTQVTGQWLSTRDAPLGLYVAPVTFDRTGRWEVSVRGNEGRAVVDVFDESVVPEVGDEAPRSETPTAEAGDDLTAISTDLEPDARLYQLSIAEAVTNGRPSVIAFATPAFCQTAVCGPTLEIVKEATDGNHDIDVVHVEPFELESARAGSLVPVETMSEWHLATEPWVFVVDADGRVTSSFEGILGREELTVAIEALTPA